MYPKSVRKLSPDERRGELVTLLTTAVRKLVKTAAGSPESQEICRKKANSSLTSLDVSEEKRLHVSKDNYLKN
jgi:hypothetical protein